ncbi:hypothetical protein RRG08_060003 [Elysia crispata]|uniref:Uncharacterized protein n=1 Tax=Elysia crispata TaxID=231223 RepID=A0AAE0YDW5_9GAST|nr:hypothetical protein RRG08_060003 [Elysia crispata]
MTVSASLMSVHRPENYRHDLAAGSSGNLSGCKTNGLGQLTTSACQRKHISFLLVKLSGRVVKAVHFSLKAEVRQKVPEYLYSPDWLVVLKQDQKNQDDLKHFSLRQRSDSRKRVGVGAWNSFPDLGQAPGRLSSPGQFVLKPFCLFIPGERLTEF